MRILPSLVLTCTVISSQVFAWGQTGHRVTGEIAQAHLTEQAQQQVKAILGTETLAQASTWPDEMRSNPSEFWKKTASPWHYVTVPKGKEYKDVGAPDEGDAVSALENFREVLLSEDASLKEKQKALRFIVHIIGDLHQPLHAGNGTDRGGNDEKVEFFKEDTNLHRVWDSGLIDRQQLSFTEWAQWLGASITDIERKAWASNDPMVWVKESTAIRDQIYPKSDDISWDYSYENIPVVRARLKQGGIRIANYLNTIFEGSKVTQSKR
ncbi:S1/P1 nuclease [Paraneptunicella aestuarii]|uniref:S1/P1 nuclease n=1 Tax=Paraneptunicella aestuarii TaxID=2831148 RepID=UPI001E3C3B4F|nr:S1/P1 nuclease [Paraneptunicella aestuarii]UAA38698.1 S1/P1 nuclease [Paraneptunicella aestuarii]